MKREFPSIAEESFETSLDGNYYSKYLTASRQEKRITKVFHNPTSSVYSAWDLGFSDSTAIWLFQVEGQRINLLEYCENSGESLPFYIAWLLFEDHFVPHDASQHDFTTGLTRTETAANLGVKFTQVPNLKIDEGIDAVRNILGRCFFDKERCAKGVQFLDAYRKQWNDQQGCWASKPLHNFASHCADAFRILALGVNSIEQDQKASTEGDLRALNSYFGDPYARMSFSPFQGFF